MTAETDESLSDNYFEANFIIIRRLGRGAFADAFQVQGRDGKHYAVKKSLHPYTGHKDRCVLTSLITATTFFLANSVLIALRATDSRN